MLLQQMPWLRWSVRPAVWAAAHTARGGACTGLTGSSVQTTSAAVLCALACSLTASHPGGLPACALDASTTINAETEATGKESYKELTENARDEYNKQHRNLHFGLLPFTLKIFWTDHINRYPSLLHFILNSTSSTLAINVAAGASKAKREDLNEKLASFSCPYRFALKPGAREKKPCGNVCRSILWTPGFLLSLIDTRWGPAASPADKQATAAVDELQRANLDMMDPDDPRPGARPMPAAVTRAAAEVTVRGAPSSVDNSEFASMAAMLGLDAAPPAPDPAPAPAAATDDAPGACRDTAGWRC